MTLPFYRLRINRLFHLSGKQFTKISHNTYRDAFGNCKVINNPLTAVAVGQAQNSSVGIPVPGNLASEPV